MRVLTYTCPWPADHPKADGYYTDPRLAAYAVPYTPILNRGNDAKDVVQKEVETLKKKANWKKAYFHLGMIRTQMLPAFSASCSELVSKWEQWVGSEESRELDVFGWTEFRMRKWFGSSYKEGRVVFQLLTEQAELVIQAVHRAYIPGYQFFPTKDNLRRKEIDREVRAYFYLWDEITDREMSKELISGFR